MVDIPPRLLTGCLAHLWNGVHQSSPLAFSYQEIGQRQQWIACSALITTFKEQNLVNFLRLLLCFFLMAELAIRLTCIFFYLDNILYMSMAELAFSCSFIRTFHAACYPQSVHPSLLLLERPLNLLAVLKFQLAVIKTTGFVWLPYLGTGTSCHYSWWLMVLLLLCLALSSTVVTVESIYS